MKTNKQTLRECRSWNLSNSRFVLGLQCVDRRLVGSGALGTNTEIKVNGHKLETVTSFNYLGSVIADEGSKPEILSRVAQTTAALTRLKPVWIDEYFSQLQDTTDALPCHIHLPECF